ncbi:hypothetical protein CR205_03420 [Alteribacter lacisalsi]|uniref:Uncharacterized protein n=1 Tax=Alteribacter lacisalsi TaxID=2045244 RepID=A0A2W0HA44_9BACI|nr:hypothetical protein [Alteribacter lacisalsi]PYZ97656.1 hypothetical protein CR205_03420 [Alteribacter lacisalsi]
MTVINYILFTVIVLSLTNLFLRKGQRDPMMESPVRETYRAASAVFVLIAVAACIFQFVYEFPVYPVLLF